MPLRKHSFVLSAAILMAGLAAGAAPQSLVEQWRGISSGTGGHVGVAAMIIETGETAELNGAGHFPMQSVYKLPISMAVLQLVDAGKLSLEKSVQIRPADFIPSGKHSPLRDQFPSGTRKTIRELIHYALVESDGTASDILLREVGGPAAVMKYLQSLGVGDLIVAHTEMEMTWKTQYEDWCTPRAAMKLLVNLENGIGISDASRALVLKDMEESQTGAARIRNLLPKGTEVADKTGSSGMHDGRAAATNDIGLVTLPDGRHMAIAIFVSDSEEADAVRDAVIAKIAREAWDGLSRLDYAINLEARRSERSRGGRTTKLASADSDDETAGCGMSYAARL